MTEQAGASSDIRSALAELVKGEPPLPSGSQDIERRGRRRLAWRRLVGGAMAVAVVVAAGLATAGLMGSATAPPRPIAGPSAATGPAPAPSEGTGAAGGQHFDGFTIGDVANAVNSALPPGAVVELGPGGTYGWQDGNSVELPLRTPAGGGALTIVFASRGCTATVAAATLLSATDLAAVAQAACDSWKAKGSPSISATDSGVETPGPAD